MRGIMNGGIQWWEGVFQVVEKDVDVVAFEFQIQYNVFQVALDALYLPIP